MQRRSACGGNCSGCEGCTFTENSICITAENKIGAVSGQTVFVETKTRLIFKFAVLVYILPIAFLILGYLVGYFLSFSEACRILCAFCLLLAGTFMVLIFQRKKSADSVSYSITSVLEDQL